MDEHKKIRVTINQEEDSNTKRHDLEYFLTPKHKKNNRFNSSKPVLNKLLKPIAFAVLLGVIFGIAFISFFSDLTPTKNNEATPVFNEDEEDDTNVDETESTPQHEDIFERDFRTNEVIQYGIFSAVENATDLVQTLSQSNIPAIIHEEDGQYYVFSMVNIQPYDREDVTSWLEGLDYEYMNDFLYKDWNFSGVSIEGNEAEVNWLEEGYELIDTDSFSSEKVSQWIDKAPERFKSNTNLTAIVEMMNNYEQQIQENSLPIYANTVKLGLLLFFEKLS